MTQPIRKIYPVYLLIDLACIGLSFFGLYILRYNSSSVLFSSIHLPNLSIYLSVFFLWSVFIIIFFNGRRLYTTDRNLSIPREFLQAVSAVAYTTIIIGAVIFFAKFKEFSRLVLGNFISLCFLLSVWRLAKRLILRRLITKGFHNINVLIVGAGRVGKYILEEIKKNPWLGLIPLISYKKREHHPAKFVLKRLFDFFAALIVLILAFSLFLAISILIKMTSKGPIFYKSLRSGFKGRLFNFYKFRSMIEGADKMKVSLQDKNEIKDGILFKMKDDPRVTPIGKFLRKHSIDELPQIINVLKGDMSLVGSRPPTPDEVEKYSHHQMQRLSFRRV